MPTADFSPDAFLESLRAVLPPGALLAGGDIPERHHQDWSGAGPVVPLAVVRPGSTEQIAAVLRLCNAHGVPVVPHGGLTGLAGAAQPIAGGIVLSLSRFNRIEAIDPAASTVTTIPSDSSGGMCTHLLSSILRPMKPSSSTSAIFR